MGGVLFCFKLNLVTKIHSFSLISVIELLLDYVCHSQIHCSGNPGSTVLPSPSKSRPYKGLTHLTFTHLIPNFLPINLLIQTAYSHKLFVRFCQLILVFNLFALLFLFLCLLLCLLDYLTFCLFFLTHPLDSDLLE